MWSRSFSSYDRDAASDQDDPRLRALRNDLHRIGESFLGGPFHVCCDVNYKDERRGNYFSPPFWEERDICQSKAAVITVPWLADDAMAHAIRDIVGQIKQSSVFEDVPGQRNTIRRVVPYDMSRLTQSFLNLWDMDFMLDPRLTQAEEIFFCQKDDAVDGFRYDDEKPRLAATLAWMQQPANAQRLAFSFLYSRLAQHYGEYNPTSVTVTKNVVRAIDRGRSVTSMLERDPFSLTMLQEQTEEETSPLAFMFKPRAIPQDSIVAHKLLVESAPQMVTDYRRLCNGSWAREQMERLEMKWPAAVPAAVHTPG